MAYTSGFFDAVDQGGGAYDRVYSASTFAHYFSLLVKNGVFPDPSTSLWVKASSNPDMSISIQPGSGWINGYYVTVDDTFPEQLTIPTANPSLSRIDSVIMGLNYVDREIQLYIKSGAVSASPSAVSLQRDNDLYELELAQITVGAGVASISQANITDMRFNTTRCGIVAGTIDQIDTTSLFAQYDAAFQTWFDDLKSQLSDDVVANLQAQINTLKTEKVAVSDKASDADMTEGTSDSKWVTPKLVKAAANPIKSFAVGDIIHSLNNLETQTEGAFIQCNGRTVDLSTGYPLLKDVTSLEGRLPSPIRAVSANTTPSSITTQSVVVLDDTVFWLAAQSSSGSNALWRVQKGGTAASITTSIGRIASQGGYLIANPLGTNTISVYTKAGTLLRTVTLPNTTNSVYSLIVTSQGTAIALVYGTHNIRVYYSNDSFKTVGTATIEGSALLQEYYSESKGTLYSNLQENSGGIYFMTTSTESISSSTVYSLYKSTDGGKTFTRSFSLKYTSGANPHRQGFLINAGFMYALSDTAPERILKYNLTGGLVLTSDNLSTSSTGPGYRIGFVKDGYLYDASSTGSYKISLDTLSVEPWKFLQDTQSVSSSSQSLGYLTKDGQFFVAVCLTGTSTPSYNPSWSTETVYTAVNLYHVDSDTFVTLFSDDVCANSSSYQYAFGPPCEFDGDIIFPCGYYNRGYYIGGIAAIKRSQRVLPELDFAYIKAKEV